MSVLFYIMLVLVQVMLVQVMLVRVVLIILVLDFSHINAVEEESLALY